MYSIFMNQKMHFLYRTYVGWGEVEVLEKMCDKWQPKSKIKPKM